MTNIQKYIDYAKTNGALDVVEFTLNDVVFDERTLLKCAFGCKDWGLNHTCPSSNSFLGLDMYKRIFGKYKRGIIIRCNNKKLSQEISFEIESQAYTDGLYWAFSLSDCAACAKCAATKNIPCVNKRKARPAFHSVGIDVFATVKKLGLPLFTLEKDSTEENWYSAVFMD